MGLRMKTTTRLIFGFVFFVAAHSALAGGKLLATGGVTQFEGAAGGGLTPWALIAGYGTRDEVGGTVFYTTLNTREYGLNAFGAALGVWDRLELSYARHELGVSSTVIRNTAAALGNASVLAPSAAIRQDIFGVKLRLFGDAIYAQDSFLPQVAVGAQFKRNLDFDKGVTVPVVGATGIPALLGAKEKDGTDIYLSATKAFLGVPAGKILLINLTARATKANAFGLLGFGRRLDPSDSSGATLEQDNDYEVETEGSLGIFLSREVLVGAEYRTQSNRLDRQPTLSSLGAPGLARESSARDFFLAYVPNKNVAVTVAYVDLGNLPFQERSNGFYLSVQASF
jgi:Protein of unknown function (DUF3034)